MNKYKINAYKIKVSRHPVVVDKNIYIRPQVFCVALLKLKCFSLLDYGIEIVMVEKVQ